MLWPFMFRSYRSLPVFRNGTKEEYFRTIQIFFAAVSVDDLFLYKIIMILHPLYVPPSRGYPPNRHLAYICCVTAVRPPSTLGGPSRLGHRDLPLGAGREGHRLAVTPQTAPRRRRIRHAGPAARWRHHKHGNESCTRGARPTEWGRGWSPGESMGTVEIHVFVRGGWTGVVDSTGVFDVILTYVASFWADNNYDSFPW